MRVFLKYIFIFTFILCLILLIYYPSINFSILGGWDDPEYVSMNPDIQSLNLRHIAKMFTSNYMGNYAPLHVLSYAVDYRFWGLEPLGYRITNLALHVLNSIFLFALIKRISGNDMVALIGALIFAIHPVQVESVAWISQRKNLLATSFMLAAFLVFIQYRDGRKSSSYYGAMILYVMALLSKVSVIIFPIYMLAYDLFIAREKITRRRLYTYVPFVFVSVIMALLTLKAQAVGGVRPSYYGDNVLEALLVVPTLWLYYLRQLIFPVSLSALYDENIILHFTVLKVVLVLALVATMGALSVYWYRSEKRDYFFWLAWAIIGLLPVSHIIPVVTLMNDRYLYFPLVGIAVLSVMGLADGLSVKRNVASQKVMTISIVLVSFVFCFVTLAMARVSVWKDTYSLFADAVEKYPNHAKIRNNLGAHYRKNSEFYRAEREFKKALEINPDLYVARLNLGVTYSQMGRHTQAIAQYKKAIEIFGNDPEVHYFLGTAYKSIGQNDAAVQEFRRALALAPGKLAVFKDLMALYLDSHRYSEALELIADTREKKKPNPRLDRLLDQFERKIYRLNKNANPVSNQ